jgi:hypothetical protein
MASSQAFLRSNFADGGRRSVIASIGHDRFAFGEGGESSFRHFEIRGEQEIGRRGHPGSMEID